MTDIPNPPWQEKPILEGLPRVEVLAAFAGVLYDEPEGRAFEAAAEYVFALACDAVEAYVASLGGQGPADVAAVLDDIRENVADRLIGRDPSPDDTEPGAEPVLLALDEVPNIRPIDLPVMSRTVTGRSPMWADLLATVDGSQPRVGKTTEAQLEQAARAGLLSRRRDQ